MGDRWYDDVPLHTGQLRHTQGSGSVGVWTQAEEPLHLLLCSTGPDRAACYECDQGWGLINCHTENHLTG